MSASPSIPKTMKAWQFTSVSGGMEKNMSINTSTPLPQTASSLAPTDSLVQVLAMALNPVDYKFAELPVAGKFMVARPASPGLDFCGRLVKTGSANSNALKPGQLVFGRLESPLQFGTCAEYVVTPRAGTIAVPDGVKVEDAASIGTAGLTAYQCIVPYAKAGDKILINGGSGGTGVFGIQIAKTLGCHVTATCSGANVKLCESLGADEVVDYRSVDVVTKLKEGGGRFSLIVDNVGSPADLYSQCHHYMKPAGTYVQVGVQVSLGGVLGLVKSMAVPGFLGGGKRKFQFVGVGNKAEDFEQLGRWMKEGKVKAVLDQVYAFEDAPTAYEKMRSSRTKGKLVVRVANA